jgi:hypothetical protein
LETVPRRRQLGPDELRDRVLAAFIVKGRLVSLPARRKKRLLVLGWLADLFRPAERYTEAQVNDVLGRYYDDFATLRRWLVDEELMQRHGGLYWRTGTVPYSHDAADTDY